VAAGWEVETVFTAAGSDPPDAVALARAAGADVAALATGVMARVATTETPPSVVAVVRTRTRGLDDLAGAGFLLVGDRIGDPGNAGTMLRSAEAAGADAVVFTAGSVDPFNPKVVRSSAGALFHVPVVVGVELADVAALAGIRIYGTTSHGATPHTEVDLRARCAVVVGNEAHGLAADAPIDTWITIPHRGRAESLNVAMAATVLVFEVARQRGGR